MQLYKLNFDNLIELNGTMKPYTLNLCGGVLEIFEISSTYPALKEKVDPALLNNPLVPPPAGEVKRIGYYGRYTKKGQAADYINVMLNIDLNIKHLYFGVNREAFDFTIPDDEAEELVALGFGCFSGGVTPYSLLPSF